MVRLLSRAKPDPARQTGTLVDRVLRALKSRIDLGTNLLDIDRWTRRVIAEGGALSFHVAEQHLVVRESAGARRPQPEAQTEKPEDE